MPDDDALISYRLGAVRSGIQATVLALLVLLAFRAIPGHGMISDGPYWLIVAFASVAVAGVRLLPWKRFFERGIGMRMLYLWSVSDILLVTGAVWATGGGGSEVWVLYMLTTVFFGAAYPPLSQILLLGFTLICYVGAVVATGWHAGAGTMVLRCGILSIVAFLVSFLSAQLLRLIDSLQQAGNRSERSAALLSTVARSARRLTLDRDMVLESLVESVLELGFDGAAVCTFDHESELFFVAHHRGLPERYVSGAHRADADLPGAVRRTGHTQILDRAHAADERIDQQLLSSGLATLIGSPVWVEGWLAGALIGATRRGAITSPEAEAFELLAAEAGLALENNRRFEEILETVERLEDLDRLKDDFLATTSHELRTPLTVILGSGLTLEQRWEEFDDSVRRELLNGVNRNARTLEGLITSLLDFASLGADSLSVTRQPCAVDEILEAMVARLGFLFSDRLLEVQVEEGLVVDADPRLLERALENLLSNAAKHTPEGTRVELSARRQGKTVVLAVEDAGPGISDEDAQHLGERFFRGGDMNTRPTKGLGLGLALVREILALHGTDLEIQTREGSGSRFSFRLPSAQAIEPGAVGGSLDERTRASRRSA